MAGPTGVAGRARARRRLLAGLTALVVVAAGCGPEGVEVTGPTTTVTTVVDAPVQGGTGDAGDQQPPAEEQPPAEARPDAGREAFDRIVASLPAGTGVAVAPVGSAQEPLVGGDLTSDVAWSTIKVPLALAAMRAAPDVGPAADRALTVSDNDAAETLWAALGGGAGAAAAVGAVLAEAGDPGTVVPSERLRPGYSIFGQTVWPLAGQARFGAGLACLADGPLVLEPMTRIDPSQRWGLGGIPGAAFKGGWGPTADGSGYLVRQFGLLPTPHGRVAVAVAAYGGDFSGGTALLSQIADTVAAELGGLPAGEC